MNKTKIELVRRELIKKHLAGQHDQRRHAGATAGSEVVHFVDPSKVSHVVQTTMAEIMGGKVDFPSGSKFKPMQLVQHVNEKHGTSVPAVVVGFISSGSQSVPNKYAIIDLEGPKQGTLWATTSTFGPSFNLHPATPEAIQRAETTHLEARRERVSLDNKLQDHLSDMLGTDRDTLENAQLIRNGVLSSSGLRVLHYLDRAGDVQFTKDLLAESNHSTGILTDSFPARITRNQDLEANFGIYDAASIYSGNKTYEDLTRGMLPQRLATEYALQRPHIDPEQHWAGRSPQVWYLKNKLGVLDGQNFYEVRQATNIRSWPVLEWAGRKWNSRGMNENHNYNDGEEDRVDNLKAHLDEIHQADLVNGINTDPDRVYRAVINRFVQNAVAQRELGPELAREAAERQRQRTEEQKKLDAYRINPDKQLKATEGVRDAPGVTQCRTPKEIFELGNTLRNCLTEYSMGPHYSMQTDLGNSAIYRAEHPTTHELAAIELQRQGDAWHVQQFYGKANNQPSVELVNHVEPWVEDNGIMS
jgi:hypothetical protein